MLEIAAIITQLLTRPRLLALTVLLGAPVQNGRAADGTTAAARTELLLDVVVNGYATSKIGDFTTNGKDLYVSRKEWGELGFKVAAIPPANAGASCLKAPSPAPDCPRDRSGELNLHRLRGISYQLDTPNQKLFVTADAATLRPALLGRISYDPDAARVKPESGTGLVIDYDLNATRSASILTYGGLVDSRVYAPYGVLDSSALVYNRGLPRAYTRLSTTYTYSQPGQLRQFIAGDTINGGLNWSRPVRLGGLQITSNFGLRPDLVTFPVPTLAGQVTVPSTVDVLINGTRQFSNAVQPGPFSITQLPIITGAGNVSVSVQDASGTTRTLQRQSFYASNQMLKPGLASYSAEIGKIRDSYGLLSNDYRQLAASASGRYGVTPWLTAEAHGEATGQFGMLGGGASLNLWQEGILSVDLAGSQRGSRAGGLVSVGIERITPLYSLAVSTQWTNPDFTDLATTQGQPPARKTIRASAGFNAGRWGAFGFAYTDTKQYYYQGMAGSFFGAGVTLGSSYVTGVPGGISSLSEQHISLASVTYTLALPRNMSFFASAFYDLHQKNSLGVVIGLSIPIGSRTTVSPGAGVNGSTPYGRIQASRSTIANGDIGYQAYISTNDPSRQMGQLFYRSAYSRFNIGVDRIDGGMTYRAGARGSLVVTDGSFFAANYIQDSFAVVDTGNVGHVHVLQENRDVGRTNSHGVLLVPELRSYNVNHIAVDPRDIPIDAQVTRTSTLVEPRDRSGVLISLRARVGHSAILHLHDQNGEPLPIGSFVHHHGEADAPIGYDGETFLQNLKSHNTITVTAPDGRTCSVSFTFTAQKGHLVDLPPLTCALGQ